ncbi:MAG: uracil-DNA glycosylase [Patescibacteria group bacterium]|jgi:uracil-DNA glycosylase family 4
MEKKEELDKIASEIAACKTCPLAKTATRPVPGNGSPNAEIMLIGEAPGYWEDQKGIPFVGAAGKLLDELLSSIDLTREDVFVTNVLKHRSPNNRDPLPEEIRACKPFLDRQIEIIQPRAIVTLGRFAMYHFLPEGKITRDHGQARKVQYSGREYLLIPMFHPAAALRNPEVEKQLREDFGRIPQEIKKQTEPPKPSGSGITEFMTQPVEEKVEEQLFLI